MTCVNMYCLHWHNRGIFVDCDHCQIALVWFNFLFAIVQDVEANTVRLKEHGQDSLILEKIPTTSPHNNNNSRHRHVSYR